MTDRPSYEDLELRPDHEHYWVDAYDDETGWHCVSCGLTEYPGDPGIGYPTRKPGIPRAVLGWVFVATLVILSILAAALLIATPRSGQQPPSTAAVLNGAPRPSLVEDNGAPTSGGSDGNRSLDDARTTGRRDSASGWVVSISGQWVRAGTRVDATLATVGRRDGRTWRAGQASDAYRRTHPAVGRRLREALTLPDTATDVTGTASWFCGGGSACTRGYPPGTFAAAAGPALRVGDWRGRIVKVCGNGRCVNAQLVDWCFCGSGRVIDLYRVAFARIADPSRGLVRVTVSWGGRVIVVPPTDTDDR